MDNVPCIKLNVNIACTPNEKQLFAFTYGEVNIDETRSAVMLANTHDNDLKESLHKKGINVEDDEFLIPLKRTKKQLWIPSYLPIRMLPSSDENFICYFSGMIGKENNHAVLKIKGNPLECINNFTKENKNG